jgi:hypothetical protein
MKVNKMKVNETGGLPCMLNLLVGKPYQIRTNIDVQDELVKVGDRHTALH